MSAELSPDELRATAIASVRKALDHLQRAQDELGAACAELSRLNGGVPVWKAASKLYDAVHALWYRVDSFRAGGRFELDSINVEALQKRRARELEGRP